MYCDDSCLRRKNHYVAFCGFLNNIHQTKGYSEVRGTAWANWPQGWLDYPDTSENLSHSWWGNLHYAYSWVNQNQSCPCSYFLLTTGPSLSSPRFIISGHRVACRSDTLRRRKVTSDKWWWVESRGNRDLFSPICHLGRWEWQITGLTSANRITHRSGTEIPSS